VITEYGEFLRMESPRAENMEATAAAAAGDAPVTREPAAMPRIVDIAVSVDGRKARAHKVLSGQSTLCTSTKRSCRPRN
jgi:hypothetical protein